MERHSNRFLYLLVFCLCSTADAAVSNTPLFVSMSATPNVMLLFDNSGSMNNIIWSPAYDPATSYEDWSRDWDPPSGNVTLSGLGNCGAWTNPVGRRGRNPPSSSSGTGKCLRLPDPVGDGNTRYTGNYLNYLFSTYPDGTDLTQGQIPTDYRLQTARDVAIDFVNGNANLRIGLASFNPASNPPTGSSSNQGGRIDAACGTPTSALVSTLNNYGARSNTPLAETFYEITRYFRGLTGYFDATANPYTSPIQYRCQRSFAIVITDGAPTYDRSFPANDPDDPRQSNRQLPDWDGLSPSPPAAFSDGSNPSGDAEGDTYYLDDLAKFAIDTDMRRGGTDAAGVDFDDPEFPIQNLRSYTVGFTINNQMLRDAAEYGDGHYFTANNASELGSALNSAIADIQARTSSAAAVASNSTRLSTDTLVYQARFSTNDWSGQLLAFPLDSGGQVSTPAWDAKDLIPAHDRRNIVTLSDGRGVAFLYDGLNASQQQALRLKPDGSNGDDIRGAAVVHYLRGDDSGEAPAAQGFRPRSSRLGDIVNSDPMYVGRQDYGFDRLPGIEGSLYQGFRGSNAYRNREPMIYVGANDGMLHGFDAQTGVERFAYVPNAVIPNLRFLTEASKTDHPGNLSLAASGYNQKHRYFVDGASRVIDAYLDIHGVQGWRTILLGSLGAGGRAVFTLDVTDPGSLGTRSPLWEFSRESTGGNEMGLAIPQPSAGRLNDGNWAAIIANGYESNRHTARLYLLDLATGTVLREFDTGIGSASRPNGLSSPIPADVDGDRIVDFIYAGDLHGNLWKFDVSGNNPAQWDVGFRQDGIPRPLFTACTDARDADRCYQTRQPITARPEVGSNPTGGQMVYFGTGKYFEDCDNRTTVNGASVNCRSNGTATQVVQSFYGIRDIQTKGNTGTAVPVGTGRAGTQLLQQSVIATRSVSFTDSAGTTTSENLRITSNNAIEDVHKGWYIDLPLDGERQVSTPILRGGRIIFTTLIPDPDPCGFGGDSWLMELDALQGSRMAASPFDVNNDGMFNMDDFVPATLADGTVVRVPVSGRQSTEGIIKTPGVITAGEREYKFASGTSGNIDRTVESAGEASGRQTWRQLR